MGNAIEQDRTEVFWQSLVAEDLEGKREPTCEPVVSVCLDEAFPDHCVEIGANLSEFLKIELIAWVPSALGRSTTKSKKSQSRIHNGS